MNYVMSLDIDTFLSLVIKAIEKREEKKAWQMWLMKYQHMDEKTFVPFSQFFKSQKQEVSKRPAVEILEEAQEIRDRIRKKSGE
jgi:hypothetical protein